MNKEHSPFERRVRRAARVALYGSLVAASATVTLVYWVMDRPLLLQADQTWTDLDYASLPEVQLLRDYVRIDTSETTGSELEGARFLAARLEAAGLEPHLERLGERQANLWAILEGESSEAIVLHNHIDVYPVETLERWRFPPFAAEIDLPFIYGRGVFDMKSIAVAQLLALESLVESGVTPKLSVIFLATGSEETDSELGAQWILRSHPELASRFSVLLTEGGVVEPVAQGDVKYWGIEFAQKRFGIAWACAPREGRLQRLRLDLFRIQRQGQYDPILTETVRRFLDQYAPSRERPRIRRLLTQDWRRLRDPFLFRGLPVYLQSLFVNEIEPFPVEVDPSGGYRMRLLFHLLPGADYEAVRERLLPEWLTHGVSLTFEEPLGSSAASPLDHPVYLALEETVRLYHPGATVGPHFLAWSMTDSRFFRQAGIPSYGFSPFLTFSTESYRADRRNERLNLPGFVRGVQLYADLLSDLAN